MRTRCGKRIHSRLTVDPISANNGNFLRQWRHKMRQKTSSNGTASLFSTIDHIYVHVCNVKWDTLRSVSLKGGSAETFLGPSDVDGDISCWRHSYVVIYRLQELDTTQRGHPGRRRHDNTTTKAFHSQSQLEKNQAFLFSHESPSSLMHLWEIPTNLYNTICLHETNIYLLGKEKHFSVIM